MKKIGIITLYHKNNNYGGVAQAYALNKYFLNQGYNSELITYQKEKSPFHFLNKNKSIKLFFKRVIGKINRTINELKEKKYEKKYIDKLKKREEKLETFRNEIPHSQIYTKENISQIENKYDFFVTGSDQCWNPGVIVGSYVFDFLSDEKQIFSYASSIAVNHLPEKFSLYMRKHLKKYNYISVREANSAKILEETIGKKVETVIDPTLLLEKNEWEQLASKRIIQEKYAFAYVLGESKKARKRITQIAKEKGLKLVTLPHIKNGVNFKFRIVDYKFGDEQMIDIGFDDFLSLIQNAEIILTDSFHAICFSYIFQKEFIALEKDGLISTSSRLKNLLNMMGLEERLITTENYHKNFSKIDYDKVEKKLEYIIDYSKKFIKKSLTTLDDKKE